MDRKWDSPKDYLSQIKYIDQRINNKQESIDALWAKATRVNKPLKSDMVQESGSFDTTALIDKVIDLQQETNEMIDCLIDLKRVIEKEIHDLDNPLFVVVLYQRYVLGSELVALWTAGNFLNPETDMDLSDQVAETFKKEKANSPNPHILS